MRVSDFSSHLRSMGLTKFCPPWPVGAFLAAPIRHQREDMGNIYLARDEDGPEFTREDEETLIDTSPVGVAVFDALTGAPLSFNREMRRILGGVWNPAQSPQEFLENLIVRRADGREISLEELSMAQALSTGETVWAEEIVIQVLDG